MSRKHKQKRPPFDNPLIEKDSSDTSSNTGELKEIASKGKRKFHNKEI